MTDEFVPIIPGAIDDLGDEHGLSWRARSMLLWLAVTADRRSGVLRPVTAHAIHEATRCDRQAVKSALDDLEDAGAIKARLPKGHEGEIVLHWHDQIVWKKSARKQGNRTGKSGNPARKQGNRTGKSGYLQANSGNGDREKKTERSSTSLSSVGARANGSAGAPPPGDTDGPGGGTQYLGADDRQRLIKTVSAATNRLTAAEVADGWYGNAAEDANYVTAFEDQCTVAGYWVDEKLPDPMPAKVRTEVIALIADVDAWLGGQGCWMPERRHGPYYDDPAPALARLGLSDGEEWSNRFYDVDATEALEEFVAAVEPLGLDPADIVADLEQLYDEAQA